MAGQGGGQSDPGPHMVAEHAPCRSVALAGCRSHADNQGLMISSGGSVVVVAANARAAIRSNDRPECGARGILRGRTRWRLGSRQLREPGASLRAAGVPSLAAAPNAPGGRLPGPARPPECGPPTALAHTACLLPMPLHNISLSLSHISYHCIALHNL